MKDNYGPIQLALVDKNYCANPNVESELMSLGELKMRIDKLTEELKPEDIENTYVVIRLNNNRGNEQEFDPHYFGLTGVEFSFYRHLELHCSTLGEIVSHSGDVHPPEGEYWKLIREYGDEEFTELDDVQGFVTSEVCGLRLRKMVEEVLGKDRSKSRMFYQFEPNRVQFVFYTDEFDVKNMVRLSETTHRKWGIITRKILEQCKLNL